jgi:uncharacterized protein YbbC (DUF1343 family)
MIQFGIDRLLRESKLRDELKGRRLGLLAHPASVTETLAHSMDAIMGTPGLDLKCAFGPQHGMRGEKQYNMIESEDYVDPIHGIPVFSLYGKTRRPTDAMLSHCDVVLVDLQDLGCRIYTYLTTLVYMMEACAKLGKSVWVLDRPNPAGRAIEGSILKAGHESFVGVGPVIMRHGLTLGEIANYVNQEFKIAVDLKVIEMTGYRMNQAPGHGWPLEERAWVNPSPNAPTLSMARCYSGTVMLEGTNLSEGRGTTRPLEGFGAPDLDGGRLLKEMERLAPEWLKGCLLRPFYFEPTFYKHQGTLCSGIQIHVDHAGYDPTAFKPYRIQALAFKAIRNLHPDYALFRDFPYEYVFDRLAIDVITGCEFLRTWVDDPASQVSDLEVFLARDEKLWKEKTAHVHLY